MSHLSDVGCSYFVHFLRAFFYLCKILVVCGVLFIHMIVPEVFKTTASDMLEDIVNEMKGRK